MQSALSHSGCKWILGGWVGFLSENLLLSHNRDDIIAHLGADRYHLIYNSLSSLTTLSIAYGYFRHGRRAGPVVAGFVPSVARTVGAFALQALGLVGFSQMAPKLQVPVIMSSSVLSPQPSVVSSSAPPASAARFQSRCPIDFAASRRPPVAPGADPTLPYGVERVTRHPQLWSLAALGAGAALASPFIAERILFGFPTIMALVGGWHQDYRYRRDSGGSLSPAREAASSHVPFVALLAGRQSWTAFADEFKGLNAIAACLVAAALAARRGRLPV